MKENAFNHACTYGKSKRSRPATFHAIHSKIDSLYISEAHVVSEKAGASGRA
jgi:hypothetical protein